MPRTHAPHGSNRIELRGSETLTVDVGGVFVGQFAELCALRENTYGERG